ncbi:TAXI family TRAP transporter solute-binding subunit [Propionivibrio sp.]|uniref:TAXI family TRAP transporter solute-binding subunit n=1 Tax=Propionivibrio sp. TaxID=2212460 RepID=UPI003BEFE5C2
MKSIRAKFVSIRDLLATAWPIVLITAIGFVVAYQFVEPAPPSSMTITTGSESGAYYAYARRYAELLAVNGITLEIKTSAGSLQNLERVKKGEADIALIQGGVEESLEGEDQSDLRSLGSVSYEPVWIFYRSEYRFDKLHHLSTQRIAVGEEGSGIRGLAMKLLEANEIPANSKNLLPIAGLSAAEALQRGEIDAAFIVAAQEAPVVQVMQRLPDVRVMSFIQADAYTRRFPFLSKVVLPRGVVDLVRDTPPRDTVLLATTANVVVRDDLHPALVSLMLQAMTEVNGKNGFFQRAGEFPAYKDHSFALSDEAKRYYKSGPPFLQRYLPFWIAVLVERLFVLILPIIILLFPLLKIAPSIYNWRVRSKIFRCYGDLKFLENELRQSYVASRHADYLLRLDRIEEDAYTRNIPLAFSDMLYTLRVHINLVREKLTHLESGATPNNKP